MLLALSLLDDYDTPSAIQLLEKDQDAVLQVFLKDPAALFRAAERQDRDAELYTIGLVRLVFMLAGGPEDIHQLKFSQEKTAPDNLNLLGSLVGVTGSNRSGNFGLQAILSALSRSKAIPNEFVDTLDIAELISQLILMTLLPSGFRSYLVWYSRLRSEQY